ncbi:MAG: hypothetical protein HY700_22005 [Gemmatimonadetes bacterium]|nr:hypothetical protein [Gemmatimonadota bacterium]
MRSATPRPLVLPRPLRSRRFYKVAEVAPGCWAHRLRITNPKQLDRQVGAWVRRSYRLMGMQRRLDRRG